MKPTAPVSLKAVADDVAQKVRQTDDGHHNRQRDAAAAHVTEGSDRQSWARQRAHSGGDVKSIGYGGVRSGVPKRQRPGSGQRRFVAIVQFQNCVAHIQVVTRAACTVMPTA